MRHLTTLLLCLLPALALGQSAVTVRGPAGAMPAAQLTLPGTPILQVDGSSLFSIEDVEAGAPNGSARLSLLNGRTVIIPAGGRYDWSQLSKPGAWTVLALFRQTSLASAPGVMGGYTTASGGSKTAWGAIRVLATGAAQYQFGDGSNFSAGQGPAASISANQWHVVAIVYTGGGATEAAIYIDGASVAVTTTSTAASSSAGAAPTFSCGSIGDANGAGVNTVTVVAACIAWDAALTADQVATATAVVKTAFGLN